MKPMCLMYVAVWFVKHWQEILRLGGLCWNIVANSRRISTSPSAVHLSSIWKAKRESNMDAGYHSVVWDANSYASGVYFVKMVAGEFVNTQKLMLVK